MTRTSESSGDASIQVGNSKINGTLSENGKVANYLGIQYATIPARFRQSQILDLGSHDGDIQAVQYGPRCPQLTIKRPETAHLYEGIKRSDDPLDEFGCLRLNIYVPAGHKASSLPVVVWIHGGGFIFGDGNSEYDGNFLVEYSMEEEKPIIFVAMNYRLGFFGFLTSKELQDEAKAAGQIPFTNMAMHDQRVALLWIQKHIHHFGGDPSKVTIAGESAGGWSVLAHLRSDIPVCQRGIILSAPNLDYPKPAEAQETFDELVAGTGTAADASASEKLKALRSISQDEVVKLMLPRLATPNYDPHWFIYQDGKGPIAGPAFFGPWVKGIVAGSTRDEAALFGVTQWKSWTSQQFADRVAISFSDPNLAKEIAEAYQISASAPQEQCLAGFIAMATDSIFSGLPYTITEILGFAEPQPPISVYRFDQADTFAQSPYKGYAYHALDNAFFVRLPAVAGKDADPDMQDTCNCLSNVTLELAYGMQPWPAFADERKIMVFNGKKTAVVQMKGDEKDRWRRVIMQKEGRVNGTFRSGNKLLGIRHCSMDKS